VDNQTLSSLTAEELAARDALHEALLQLDLNATEQASLLTQEPTESIEVHKFQFTGSASEFFRIWIVNVFLTIITLGIYNAWAKVRTRQYFYAHTRLDGHAFEYLANPISILKGNLVLGVGVIAYYLSRAFLPWLSLVILAIFGVIFPLLIYKSLRFRAHNSAYRNLRFRFHGELGDSYVNYLWMNLLIPFTLGLIYPYIMFRQKRYFFENFSYGKTYSRFKGSSSKFYAIYIPAFVVMAVFYGIFIWSMRYLGPALYRFGLSMPMFYVVFAIIYFAFLFCVTMTQHFVSARIRNHVWNSSELMGKVRFKSTLNPWHMLGIRLSNTLAIVVSLGLLTPWAKVRSAKYILSHLTVVGKGSLEDFVSATGQAEDALGDVAADFMDFDIGL
jgi:uncharacterized membrane protein YjgN (DUF898 family)